MPVQNSGQMRAGNAETRSRLRNAYFAQVVPQSLSRVRWIENHGVPPSLLRNSPYRIRFLPHELTSLKGEAMKTILRVTMLLVLGGDRSEERRVGKECR